MKAIIASAFLLFLSTTTSYAQIICKGKFRESAVVITINIDVVTLKYDYNPNVITIYNLTDSFDDRGKGLYTAPRFSMLYTLSLIHISEPTRQAEISYAVFCLKK